MKKTAIAEVVDAPPERTVTTRASDKFILRLPDGMREQLAEVAERERRSMNSVALDALAMYFASKDAAPKQSLEAAVRELSERQQRALREIIERQQITFELVKKIIRSPLARKK
jgi:hypothetical protein